MKSILKKSKRSMANASHSRVELNPMVFNNPYAPISHFLRLKDWLAGPVETIDLVNEETNNDDNDVVDVRVGNDIVEISDNVEVDEMIPKDKKIRQKIIIHGNRDHKITEHKEMSIDNNNGIIKKIIHNVLVNTNSSREMIFYENTNEMAHGHEIICDDKITEDTNQINTENIQDVIKKETLVEKNPDLKMISYGNNDDILNNHGVIHHEIIMENDHETIINELTQTNFVNKVINNDTNNETIGGDINEMTCDQEVISQGDNNEIIDNQETIGIENDENILISNPPHPNQKSLSPAIIDELEEENLLRESISAVISRRSGALGEQVSVHSTKHLKSVGIFRGSPPKKKPRKSEKSSLHLERKVINVGLDDFKDFALILLELRQHNKEMEERKLVKNKMEKLKKLLENKGKQNNKQMKKHAINIEKAEEQRLVNNKMEKLRKHLEKKQTKKQMKKHAINIEKAGEPKRVQNNEEKLKKHFEKKEKQNKTQMKKHAINIEKAEEQKLVENKMEELKKYLEKKEKQNKKQTRKHDVNIEKADKQRKKKALGKQKNKKKVTFHVDVGRKKVNKKQEENTNKFKSKIITRNTNKKL